MAEWKSGQVILGEYLIKKELGKGGMGRVWLVKSNSTGRQFAIKQTILKDDKSRKAFLAELQTWIDLPEHPNIVPCRFFRTVGDEIVIFTDYIDGGSLKDWIDQGKLTTLEQILDVAIQFAWGLHAIHERGLVHQDVKPGNVLMTADGTPMVADFGLARARQIAPDGQFVSLDSLPGQQSVLVSSGGMTPAYASPEQKAGQPLSRKTDIWSWGVSVLDMFMGGVSCPHGGHIAAGVLESYIENGWQADGLPEMPEGAADILRNCFAPDPAKRWVNLEAAIAAAKGLFQKAAGRTYPKHLQQGCVTPAKTVQHDRKGAQGGKWSNPHEWLRKAYVANGRDPASAESYRVPDAYSRKGAAVVDLAIYEEAERQFKAALSVWNTNTADQYACLLSEKAEICGSQNDAEGYFAAVDLCIEIRRRLVEQGGGRREHAEEQLAGVLMNKAVTAEAYGDLACATDLYDQCIALLRRLTKQDGRWELAGNMALALMNKGNLLRTMGSLTEATNLYDESIDICQRVVGQDGRQKLAEVMARVLLSKASVSFLMDDYAGTVNLCDECIKIFHRLASQDEQNESAEGMAKALMNKACALSRISDLAGGLKSLDEGIAIYRRLVEQEWRQEWANDLAKALMNKASTLTLMRDSAGATKLYDESIGIYRLQVEQNGRGELAEELAQALINMAVLVRDQGNLADAVKLNDECIAIRRRLVEQKGRPELEDNLAVALEYKAVTLLLMRDKENAILLFDECIAIRRRLVEQEGRKELAKKLAYVLSTKGALICTGDSAGAVDLFNESVAIYRRLVEQEGLVELANELTKALVGEAQALMSKANGMQKQGDHAGAVEFYDRCIAIHECFITKYGKAESHNGMAVALLAKADSLVDMGNYIAAEPLFNQCCKIWQMLLTKDTNGGWAGKLATATMKKGLMYALKGQGLLNSGNPKGAANVYDQCIALWSPIVEQKWDTAIAQLAHELANALTNKAVALQCMGDNPGAVTLYSQCITIRQRLVELHGRNDLSNDLANAVFNKACAKLSMGDYPEAVELFDQGITIWRRLVQSEGRHELLGDLAWGRLYRAAAIKALGAFNETEVRNTKEAYQTVSDEASRTGRNDLHNIVSWAQNVFSDIL